MTQPADPTCAATTGCTRRPANGTLICRGHLERIGTILRDLEDEAALLTAVPSMQQRTGNGHGTLASERAPARLDVLVHTDRRRGTGKSETDDDALAAGDTLPILDVLHSWARIVREDRGFATRAAVTISGERDLLTRQLDYVAAQPWIDEAYTDLTRLLGQLRAANGTGADRPLGWCIVQTPEPCAGTIWRTDVQQTVWRVTRDRCTRTDVAVPDGPVTCDTCGTAWDGADLDRLRLVWEQEATEAARPHTDDGRPMYTAEELVAQGAVSSVSNVRVMAHRSGRVSVDGHYDPAWFVKVPA
jgi:hypothetical protein